ncbi:MAG: DNA mismatch repair endonuclease MutL [Clostridia bacterium]|nr:DNA mismatch repair endonuclease MutL [Clostridia bacterium]
MGKINVLGTEVYNRIAAGEVVDGPYSVVKELVENSLDAGATEIEICIDNAGKTRIMVSDNGSGIEKDDLPKAFLPHATSKISSASDLDLITTLGFRGEALPSIASVSVTEIVSAVKNDEGYSITAEGQNIGMVSPCAAKKGTSVTVKSLFYNTPVRARFLRADKKEEADVTAMVTRFILGNPDVSFCYIVDGRLKLTSYGEGLEEAVAGVYGADTVSNCFNINAEKNNIRVRGYIGSQNYFKPNKTYESVYLNGRWVNNSCISTAMSCAYQYYAMKRQYPFYVLFVDVPADFVDVNVHPNKSDVRFVDTNLIFSTVYKIVSSILDGTTAAADFVVDTKRSPAVKSTYKDSPLPAVFGGKAELSEKKFTEIYENKTEIPVFREGKTSKPEEGASNLLYKSPPPSYPNDENYLSSEGKDEISDEIDTREREEQRSFILDTRKYVGALFNTFLIFEVGDEAFLIDQHAAHERLLFDEYSEKIAKRTITRQCMLVPYVFNVTPGESQFLSEKLPLLSDMGFSVELFGDSAFRVYEVPQDLQSIDLKCFFDELLSGMGELKNVTLTDILRDKIAMTACKHAIKGGNILTDAEIENLFSLLKGDMGLKCPHGRPICVKLTKTQLEKMFKRVV